MLQEFRAFILERSAVDMAVGLVMGVAFGRIVETLVEGILLPPVGLLAGSVDFRDVFWVLKDGSTPGPYATLTAADQAGAVTLDLGLFATSVVQFVLVAAAMFLVIQWVRRLRPAAPDEERDCPECLARVPTDARRCRHCTQPISPE